MKSYETLQFLCHPHVIWMSSPTSSSTTFHPQKLFHLNSIAVYNSFAKNLDGHPEEYIFTSFTNDGPKDKLEMAVNFRGLNLTSITNSGIPLLQIMRTWHFHLL